MSGAIGTGLTWVQVFCPRCHRTEVAAVILTPVLTITDDEEPTLRVRAKSKPVDHRCGQESLLDILDAEAQPS